MHCSLREIKDNPGEPIARLTPLGWTSIGASQNNPEREVNQLLFFVTEERQLNTLMKQMWDIEEPQSSVLVRSQDKEAEETVFATLKPATDGFVVGLPWKSAAPPLENNFSMALTRL